MSIRSQCVSALGGILLGVLPGTMLFAQAAPPAPPEPPAVLGFSTTESRSYLGVGVTEIDSERSKALKLKEELGVEITRVDEDSPASKAGLKNGDVVVEFNGQRVEGTEQFVRLVREIPPGRSVKVVVWRGAERVTVSAVIGNRRTARAWTSGQLNVRVPEVEVILPDIPRALMSWRSGMLGVEAESLDGQLATFFGVKEGVLVRSVTKGTAAEKAGIKAGDVILKIDDTKVSSPREITSAIRTARTKKTFPVVVMRERKEVSLSVTMEPEPERGLAPRARPVTVRGMQL
jgi:serine protease Do